MGIGHLKIAHPYAMIVLGVCSAVLVCACSPSSKEPSKTAVFERVPRDKLPQFEDDLDSKSLQKAIENSLAYFERIPANQKFSLGNIEISAEVLKTSLLHFLKLLEGNRLDGDSVAQSFDIYSTNSKETSEQFLVTGYYEPVVEGRLERDGNFCYPLYGLPPDLFIIELAAFDPARFPGERLVGRAQGNQVVPYYTRAEIDGEKKIEQYGCQLAWLKDPVDVFFLHVQGSGSIKLRDGRLLRMGYAGSNGRPYKSIGKVLIDRGAISSEEMSLQAIRSYLRNNVETRDEVMWHNESYVFFRWVKEGPMGSLNVPLTAGRSIATDPRWHPPGALAYLETVQPIVDEDGQVISWGSLRRWVLNQDTGGAIKGPGRVDLFCGTGDQAEAIAGRMKHPGKLYFFVKKGESLN